MLRERAGKKCGNIPLRLKGSMEPAAIVSIPSAPLLFRYYRYQRSFLSLRVPQCFPTLNDKSEGCFHLFISVLIRFDVLISLNGHKLGRLINLDCPTDQ